MSERFVKSTPWLGFLEEERILPEPLREASAPERRISKTRSKIPGCSTLSLENQPLKGIRRSRFSLARRREVAKVRHIGACLRCRSMKISVSSIK